MFAAVDLGSNSFRMHVGRYEGGAIKVVKSARDPIRLASALNAEGYLSQQAITAAVESMTRFGAILQDYSLDAVRVVATNTLRVAKNAQDFIPYAERAIGYPIEIISGEEEGRLIYMGVANALGQAEEQRLVIDIGGGSTELIVGRGPHIRRVESFSIGNVNQSLAFFGDGSITEAAFAEAILSARSQVEDAILPFGKQHWSKAYGSSGTMRAIAFTISRNDIGDGRMTLKNVEALKQYLISRGNVSRIDLIGLKTDRMPVIMGGLSVLIGLMRELKIDLITPVQAGLRLGVMWDLQLRATKHDRREESVDDFVQRLQIDPTRARQVAAAAVTFYELLRPNAGAYGKHLLWSGLLHDVGQVVSHTGYHKHSAYLVANADLPGFTTREQKTMSTLLLGQKGNLRKIGASLYEPDFAKALLSLRLAVMFTHAHIELDLGALSLQQIRLKMKNKIEVDIKEAWVAEHPTMSYWMQKEQEFWREVGMEFVIRVSA
ncbi:MAG: exopolyphosphatase [Herbaspirillum sp.]|nr:exopolyphosphatase [Herbaspirillum sp.]